jgi:hypothetical protein
LDILVSLLKVEFWCLKKFKEVVFENDVIEEIRFNENIENGEVQNLSTGLGALL